MKKLLFVALMMACIVISGVTVFATEETVAEDVMLIMAPIEDEEVVIDAENMVTDAIVIDGNKLEIAQDMGKVTENDGVVFVPVRFVLETMGYQVSWSNAEQMVMGINLTDGQMIIMQVNNNLLFYTQGQGEGKVSMESSVLLNPDEGRTYVPVKALAEALGYNVGFDAEINTVTLSK